MICLDTNAVISALNQRTSPVLTRIEDAIASGATLAIASIVLFELWYGVAKSAKQDFNRKRLETFLSGPVLILPFEEADSRVAGTLRAALEASGKPIGAYDLLIAGQALRHHLTLVTSNVAEFSRVKGLSWEDWAKP